MEPGPCGLRPDVRRSGFGRYAGSGGSGDRRGASQTDTDFEITVNNVVFVRLLERLGDLSS